MRLRGKRRPLSMRTLRFLRIWFTVIPLVIMVVGGFFVVMGINELQRAIDSQFWPTAPGKVVSSVVHEGWTSGGKGRSRHRTYTPEVKYEFTVDGRAFSGQRINFRVRSEGQSDALSTVARYPEGATVEVRFHPDDPELCALECGADWFNAVPIGVGFFAIGFCVVFLWFCNRWFRRAAATISLEAPPTCP